MSSLIDIRHPLNVCKASAGTGKTFTLAAYYVGLLLSGESYRSILAVTFTNKATAEMRERIILYLQGIAEGGEDDFLARARQFMLRHYDATDEELRARARVCFNEMLLDYDNVQVQTIDSFLQSLLSGIAGVLRLSTGLNTELDLDHVISTAVDQLLTTHLTDEVRHLLEQYLNVQLERERQWDVRNSIRELAKELYNEAVQSLDAQDKVEFDAQKIENYRNRLAANWQHNPWRQELAELMEPLRMQDYTLLKNGKAMQGVVNRLLASVDEPEKIPAKDLYRGLTDGQYEKAASGAWKELPAEDVQAVVRATDLGKQLRCDYFTYILTIDFSHEMQLMSALRERINELLAQQNSALLAQTANRLCEALHGGDADFILEKAGIRYKHVLIDEFQDTSTLQWEVFQRLLDDLLAASGNTLLIVGDIKQSIYRWRNGDWHIMKGLGKTAKGYQPYFNEAFPNLVRNYRSRENVVRFNLSLFRHIIDHTEEPLRSQYTEIYDEGFRIDGDGQPVNLQDYYQAKKSGGYVRFRAFGVRRRAKDDPEALMALTPREVMTYDMFDTMEQLLARGAHAGDFMVLVRRNREAREIAEMHAGLDSTRYPRLSAVRFVSSDSYVLEASRDVQIVIHGLRYITDRRDVVAARFIAQATHRDVSALGTLSPVLPLYEMVSEVIRLLLCDAEGLYYGSESAYLDALLDRTRDYVTRYGSHLHDFLGYWEDTMHTKSISSPSDNAVRIMTVHSSKGLEAQTLFVPFCNWEREAGHLHSKVWCEARPEEVAAEVKYVPITEGSAMAESEYHEAYAEEHLNLLVDNLNMLYVALTRARDNLYVSSDFTLKDNTLGTNDHVGRYLLESTHLTDEIVETDVLKTIYDLPYAEYESGEPVIADEQEKKEVDEHMLQLCSNSERARFVQSQDSLLYTEYGEAAERRAARIDMGNICHEVFARLTEKIASKHDWQVQLNGILDDFETQGLIESEAQRKEAYFLVSKAWNDPQMQKWFRTPYTVEAEQALYMDGQEYRPDRVMIDKEAGKVIVVDYKFGVPQNKYYDQVRLYMRAMELMGYNEVEGYLWYARSGTLDPVPNTP